MDDGLTKLYLYTRTNVYPIKNPLDKCHPDMYVLEQMSEHQQVNLIFSQCIGLTQNDVIRFFPELSLPGYISILKIKKRGRDQLARLRESAIFLGRGATSINVS